jgi:chromosome segregation protein
LPDAPPAKLAFYTPPARRAPGDAPAALPRLADLLRLHDAGQKALLADWLEGCYTAASPGRRAGQRGQLTPARSSSCQAAMPWAPVRVSFYAPDSEQAGLLARAQEIENLDKQLRAQALMATRRAGPGARRGGLHRRLPAPGAARREAAEAQARAHQLQVEVLRLSQQADQARLRARAAGRRAGRDRPQLEELQERRVTAEARFEELDMQLADAQERHAELDERVIEAERRLNEAREQQRSLERQAQEAQFSPAQRWQARRAELQRAIDTAAQQIAAIEAGQQRPARSWPA